MTCLAYIIDRHPSGLSRPEVGPVRSQIGYTLMEALVVIAIIGVLMAAALPSFSASLDAVRVQGLGSRLAGSFAIARLEAIKTATPTVVCASDDASGCGNDWTGGWLVYRDDDRDGVRDPGEPVLRRGEAAPNYTVSVRVPSTPATDTSGDPDDAAGSAGGTALNAVTFNYRGFPNSPAIATFTRNAASSTVTLGLLGRSETQ